MKKNDIYKILNFLLKRWAKDADAVEALNIFISCGDYLMIEYRSHNLNVVNVCLSLGNSWSTTEALHVHFKRFLSNHSDKPANILDFLFKEAKTYEIYALNTPFIYKGESLEEIKIKSDLEDVA